MAKKLIIAEKPSVAADIARALGGFKRSGDYFESDDYVVSSAVGHLLELRVPEEHDVKRGKWSFARLPVIPPEFTLAPIEKSETRLNLLLRLMKRKDVGALVNACDAGREGELIFRYIVQHARNKKPIERLWLQSMTPQSIRDGFASLRRDKELLPLADAAKSRSEAAQPLPAPLGELPVVLGQGQPAHLGGGDPLSRFKVEATDAFNRMRDDVDQAVADALVSLGHDPGRVKTERFGPTGG